MGLVNVVKVHCLNGCPSILLPDPIRDQRATNQLGIPIRKFDLIVACPHCGLVADYQDARRSLNPILRQQLTVGQRYTSPVVALRPCGQNNCEVRIEIQTLAASGQSIAEIGSTISKWQFSLHCPLGPHWIQALPQDSYDIQYANY